MLDTAVLSEAQREHYQRSGWVAVPDLVDAEWLERLRRVTDEFVDASRTLTESNLLYDLDVGHSAAEPRLRRLSSPTDLHETYWEFASQSVITDVAVDLLGPDVKFHHSKLNFKAPRGGEEVKWHQDIQFWPHTNYHLLTIGVFLEDVEAGMGEVGFVSGSHDGPLFDLYDEDDRWTGALRDRDVEIAGARRHYHRAQLPHRPRVGAQPVGPPAAAPAPDLRRRRRVRLHRPGEAVTPRRRADPR
jgi:ectoine hydroxylase-related dioxygenase (phytanoyl-CoA dioxygenase family)